MRITATEIMHLHAFPGTIGMMCGTGFHVTFQANANAVERVNPRLRIGTDGPNTCEFLNSRDAGTIPAWHGFVRSTCIPRTTICGARCPRRIQSRCKAA